MPNSLSQVPKGSLLQAQNVVVDYNGLLSVRRGIKQFGTNLATLTGNPNTEIFQEFFYKGTKLIWYGDSTAAIASAARAYFAYDSDGLGTWVQTTHPFPSPAYKLTDTYRSTQSNNNLYLTSANGILKTDAPANPLYSAGGLPGLDGSAALTDVAGFMSTNTEVAYRITWTFTDANHNAVEGAPSTRVVIANNSGGSRNVQLTFTIPHGATTAQQWKIYRSPMSATGTTAPSDELQEVLQGNPTSTDISNGFFTVKDTVPQSQLGAALYTNSGQQGIAQANTIPPLSNDLCFYFGYVIYGSCTTQQKFLLSLLSSEPPNGIQIGDTFTVANGATQFILTGAASENIGLGQFQVFSGGTPGSDLVQTKQSLIHVLNRQSQTLVYAFDATDPNNTTSLPGDFFLQEQGVGGGPFYVFSSRSTCWTPALQPILNFTISTVVDMTHLTVVSTTGITAGDTITQSTFATTVTTVMDATHLVVANTTGFTTGTAQDISVGSISLAGGGKGMGFCSKFQQPEAVPLANTINVGNPNFEWLRCLPLRNSVIVLKQDGLFQLTGTTFPFTVTTLDTGTILTAPESCAVMNNQVFAYTNQGVVAISETGPGIISRPIENILQPISSVLYPNFPVVTFGTAYQTDRKYLMSTISSADKFQKATIQYVYDTITESWTTYLYPIPVWDILESPTEQRLYVTSASTAYPYVFQERKTFTRIDFADVELPVIITGFSGTTVTLTDTSQVQLGWSLVQLIAGTGNSISQVKNISVITGILNSTQITVADTIIWDLTGTPFTAIEQPIPVAVRYCPISGTGAYANMPGNPSLIKFFKEVQFFFQNVQFTSVGVSFSSDFLASATTIPLVPVGTSVGWGQFPWGQIPWGGLDPFAVSSVRTYVPIYARRAHWLNLSLSLNQAMVGFTYGGCVVQYTDVTTRSK